MNETKGKGKTFRTSRVTRVDEVEWTGTVFRQGDRFNVFRKGVAKDTEDGYRWEVSSFDSYLINPDITDSASSVVNGILNADANEFGLVYDVPTRKIIVYHDSNYSMIDFEAMENLYYCTFTAKVPAQKPGKHADIKDPYFQSHYNGIA